MEEKIAINDELIMQWEPKVQKIASSAFVVDMDRDDIAQELRIAIIKAAQGFQEDKGVIFHTYLHTSMVNTIRTLISKGQRLRIEPSLETSLSLEIVPPSLLKALFQAVLALIIHQLGVNIYINLACATKDIWLGV